MLGRQKCRKCTYCCAIWFFLGTPHFYKGGPSKQTVAKWQNANTRTSVLKNLTFPNHEFGKGQYAFYPMKLFRPAEIPKFHKAGSLQTGSNAFRSTKNSIVKHYFGGLSASKVHESF